MKQMQLLFDETIKIAQEKKEKMRDYKEILNQSEKYFELKNEIKSLREQMKNIELDAMEECEVDIKKLNKEILGNKEMLSDLAVNELMDKGSVSPIKDEFGNIWEGEVKVVFKKSKK